MNPMRGVYRVDRHSKSYGWEWCWGFVAETPVQAAHRVKDVLAVALQGRYRIAAPSGETVEFRL
jgi:hypothetical protein